MKISPFASVILSLALAACVRGAPSSSPVPVLVATPAASPDTASDVQPVVQAESATTADNMFAPMPGRGAWLSDTTASGPAADADTYVEEIAAPSWDIDVRSFESHERVAHYVRIFGGPARARIAQRLEHGTQYFPMMRSKFREAGLPEDMIYLALIESGYNHDAYSRAAAVGMWQFMTTTARGFGLRVDWWVDERRDPVRSTDAATRFLRVLNDQLGSMYLAAAAYNGGPGRVSRGLTRFASELEGRDGDDRFFALAEQDYLPSETKNYVPQLIAAALVAKEPERYGLSITARAPYDYDSVHVPAATPLKAVARASGSTPEEISELNPHILRGVTPPRTSWWVRVPVGHSAGFDSAFAALGKDELTPWKRVISKKGQTPASLARAHGLTAAQLGWYNQNLKTVRRTGQLVPGQTILVPRPDVAAMARDVPDPSLERYSSSRTTRNHVVTRGETLSGIAQRYGTSVPEIQRLNGLKKTVIYAGQELVVKGSPRKPAPRKGTARKRAGSRR